MVRGFGSGDQFKVEWFDVLGRVVRCFGFDFWAPVLDIRSNGSSFGLQEWFAVFPHLPELDLRSNGSRFWLWGSI